MVHPRPARVPAPATGVPTRLRRPSRRGPSPTRHPSRCDAGCGGCGAGSTRPVLSRALRASRGETKRGDQNRVLSQSVLSLVLSYARAFPQHLGDLRHREGNEARSRRVSRARGGTTAHSLTQSVSRKRHSLLTCHDEDQGASERSGGGGRRRGTGAPRVRAPSLFARHHERMRSSSRLLRISQALGEGEGWCARRMCPCW